MFFFFIIGTHYFTWGSDATQQQQMRCGECGTIANFQLKKGMRFITLFFIIPLIPISGVDQLMQCPNCKARYRAQG